MSNLLSLRLDDHAGHPAKTYTLEQLQARVLALEEVIDQLLRRQDLVAQPLAVPEGIKLALVYRLDAIYGPGEAQ